MISIKQEWNSIFLSKLLIYSLIKYRKIENELEMKLVSDGWNRKSNQTDAECVYSEMINDTYFLHLPYESVG